MSPAWKVAVVVLAIGGIVSTPLFWLLNNPDSGQLVGASVQGTVAIGALVWSLFQHPATLVPAVVAAKDAVSATGEAKATGGASARTGVTRPGGAGSGSAKAERTGNANAEGRGSTASTGIDYT